MSKKAIDTGSAGADSDLVTLRPDQAVGRYRIVSVLGQGGFGITYRALDSELGREVAIKEYLPAALAVRQDGTTVVPRSTGAAEDFVWGRDRFIGEGRTLAALHRVPGIVLVHDFLETNGTAYLVMELLGGQTLQARVASGGPLDAASLEALLRPLLDGLEQVHAAGFLHRDIKPANILLDDQGRPTLIDFGASRAAVAGRSQVMTAVFTPGYAAVEQFTAAKQGPWTDIYGLAATLHFAVAGQPPPNAVDRVLDDAYVPLADGRRPVPQNLLAAIDAGLAVRAADRPQSIAAWRGLLSQPASAASEAPATVVMRRAPTAAAAASPSQGAGRSRAAMAFAAVAVAGAAAGGWFLVGPRSTTTSPPAPPALASAPTSPAPDRGREELEEARREQKTALNEAAGLRAEAEARRRSDEEAALRRKIEDEMRQKAEAEEASRRQAAQEAARRMEAQAAAQRQADEEAKSKATAEAARSEEADAKAAGAAETALHLAPSDRQRLQVALTALGFATGGTDGVFGPRSREMIAAWQKKNGRPTTGYISAETQRDLLRDAQPALARYDDEQKKAADPQNQAAAAGPAPGPAAKGGSGQCDGSYSSQWCRAAFQGFPSSCWNVPMTIRNGAISGSWTSSGASEAQTFSGRIGPAGEVSITYNGIGTQTYVNQHFTAALSGSVAGGVLTASGRAGANGRNFSVRVQCR
jgi:serine/threonine protein kinase/peptidoglycan hydrolase-like protein with peptidoglycan-binding domain